MKIRDRIVELRRVKAGELLPNPKNWRTHPEAQQNALRGLLAEVGIAGAVLARETEQGLMLIDGHLRADVDPNISWPVLVLDVTEAEADKLLASIDPLASMAETDAGKIASLLAELNTDSQALQDLFDSIEPQEQQEEEAGEVMDLHGVLVMTDGRIICGDNVETLATFNSDCIDMTVTSPPYGELRTYGGHSWDFEGLAKQLWRVTKPGGVVVWVVADQTIEGSESGDSFRQALRFKEIGFRLHDTMIWHKSNALPLNDKRYEPAFEYMFVLAKGSLRTWNPIRERSLCAGKRSGGTQIEADGSRHAKNGNGRVINATKVRQNIWTTNVGGTSGKHPAIFPEALARDHILSWSNEGDTVLDPFAGSFTTCRAAKDNGREWIGIEINPEYCEIGRRRMSQDVLLSG